MNKNYFFEKALESGKLTCLHCKHISETVEQKIAFYQCRCQYCGNNPFKLKTVLTPNEQVFFGEPEVAEEFIEEDYDP